MSVYAGPEIITDGLVLALDAGNTKSYSGSGGTWFDLSGTLNNGTLINSPTFSSNNGGCFTFSGSNYISSFPSIISDSGSKTIISMIYPTTTNRVGIASTRAATDGFAFAINRTTAGNLTYYHTGGTTIETAAGITTNTWHQVAVTYDLSSATVILYVNGSSIASLTSFSTITTATTNGLIGSENSNHFVGNISLTQIYNRVLSNSEIRQNFNATRGRFGI